MSLRETIRQATSSVQDLVIGEFGSRVRLLRRTHQKTNDNTSVPIWDDVPSWREFPARLRAISETSAQHRFGLDSKAEFVAVIRDTVPIADGDAIRVLSGYQAAQVFIVEGKRGSDLASAVEYGLRRPTAREQVGNP